MNALVEERHVKEIAIRLLNKETGKSEIHLNPLYDPDDGTELWAIHPSLEVDVAAISLGTPEDGLQFEPAEEGEIMTLDFMRKEGCTEGDTIFVVGYPYSLTGLSKGSRAYPLVRSGCIARIADTYARESETYLIDVTIFPGNSGGPVISKPSHFGEHIAGTSGTNKSGLIGMVSGYLEYFDEAVSTQTMRPRVVFTENSGIAKVETVDNMLKTLQLLKNRISDKFPKGQP
jgi:hypothetical protein